MSVRHWCDRTGGSGEAQTFTVLTKRPNLKINKENVGVRVQVYECAYVSRRVGWKKEGQSLSQTEETRKDS